ncbi:sensor histidine kinase [Halobellus sp. EA9]|uniref:sensor histidine kinase n=1 Tax=Halobellus sp. EA9 TaxID=3421647 RepID=UPI003EB74095
MDGLSDGTVGNFSAFDGGTSRSDAAAHAQLYDIVLDISTSLMSAEPDEFETKVRWSLESVGAQVGADRGQAFQVRGDDFESLAQWTDDDVDPTGLRRIDSGEFDWLGERMRQFDNVAVSRLGDLPSDAPIRDRLRDADVGAAVFLPVVDDWSLEGFVRFDVERGDRRWSDTEIDLLRTVADMIGHSLARVRRETQLRDQNERLETFASVLSHDLRNPLNVMTGSLAIEQSEGDSEHVDRALRAANRMETLVDQVLDLARQGRDVDDPQRLRLDAVVRRAWETVETSAADLRFDGELGAVSGDPERLRAAFENLFRNAIEHAGDDVTVRIGRLDDGFYLADDGPGIPEDERGSVFDRGFTTEGGTGLGLAIVRSVVEAHGWSIEAVEGNDGARFEISDVAFVG